MTALRVLASRLLDVVLGRRREDRLEHEIEAHLDLLTEEHIARGLAPAEARRAARAAFGGVERIKADYRDQRGLPALDALILDLRFALRLLRRDRAFSVAAVAVLALGIGVNNMLFTVLNAHTLRGLPIPAAGRVLAISGFDDRNRDFGVSYPEFVDLRDACPGFGALIAVASAQAIVSGDGRSPERFEAAFMSGDAYAVVGGGPVRGRGLMPADDDAGAAGVVTISHTAWQTRYGADPAILGRSILVNGDAATIVGVMPDRSGLPSAAQVWLPLSKMPGLSSQGRSERHLRMFGRVRDGVRVEEAGAEAATVLDRLFRAHPDTAVNMRARVTPINERYFAHWTHPAWFAFIAAGFLILVISAANVANLMLARGVSRTREVAIRTSLGASRARVIRQLLIEGVTLAAAGGLVGLAVAAGGVRLFRSAIPATALPYWLDYTIDARVIAALVIVSSGTVLIFALLPALHTSKADVNEALKEGGVAAGGRGVRRWMTAFLAAEFALAVVLLAQVSVSFRSRLDPVPSDAALATRSVLTAAITLPPTGYATPERRLEFHRRLQQRLRGLPDVAAAAVVSALPLTGAPETGIEIAGHPSSTSAADVPAVRTVVVSTGWLDTLDLHVVRGRGLTDADGAPGQPNVVVNEELVRRLLHGADPIGQRVALASPGTPPGARSWHTIVGVVPDICQRPMPRPDAIVYLPYAANPVSTAMLLVRSGSDAAVLGPRLREEVAALDAGLPLDRMRVLEDVVRDATWNGRLSHTLILALTFIAIAVSTVGLYAVTSHAVSLRVQELGIRMALGAGRRHLAGLVFRRAVLQLALGLLGGTVCSMLWARAFDSGRAGVLASDPGSLAAIGAVLLVVAVIGCAIPVRRATRLDPSAAIRRGA